MIQATLPHVPHGTQKGTPSRQWQVWGTAKKPYKVTRDGKGQWSCSCPAWIYTSPRKDCKHIVRVMGLREEGGHA